MTGRSQQAVAGLDTSEPSSERAFSSRHAQIAAAAYRRGCARGFARGHELEDWLAAEREIDALRRGPARHSDN